MKYNNKSTANFVHIILLVLVFFFVLSILLYLFPFMNAVKYVRPLRVSVVSGFVIFVISLYGSPYFEFDSSGEVLILKNKNRLLSTFLKAEKIADFPKYKLIRYKLKRGIFGKRLELFLKSKNTPKNQLKIVFDVTYVSNKSLAKIKASLSKVVRNNENNNLNQGIVLPKKVL